MPLPKPTPQETRETFMQRCMKDSIMTQEYPTKEQRIAICAVQWRNR